MARKQEKHKQPPKKEEPKSSIPTIAKAEIKTTNSSPLPKTNTIETSVEESKITLPLPQTHTQYTNSAKGSVTSPKSQPKLQIQEKNENIDDTFSNKHKVKEIVSHLLDTRPQVKDLVQSNIVEDQNISPLLQASKHQLEKNLIAAKISGYLRERPSKEELQHKAYEHMESKLESRPTAQELKERGLLPDSQVAPSLVVTAKQLERHIVGDSVAHMLENRPTLEELVSHNIVEGSDIAPAIQASKHQLEKNIAGNNISQCLRHRPSVEVLQKKGIIVNDCDNEPNKDNSFVIDMLYPSGRLTDRERYAIALKSAFRLWSEGLLDDKEKGLLKNLILSDDKRIMSAIECYELDHDAEEMLDSFYRIAKLA